MKPSVALIFTFLGPVFAQFEVPDALVEVFRPRGLRVSIPDQEGIKLFAFHGKINEEMNGREGGYFSRDIVKAKNGRWTFYDPTADLKVGDILYYWTYVDYFDGKNKLGYVKDDQQFQVTELLEKESSGCKQSVTVSNQNKMCGGKLIFNENFTTFQSNLWVPEVKFAGAPDYEFVWYGNRPENLAVKDDHLEIRPVPTEEVYGEGFVTKRREVDIGNKCTGAIGTTECIQEPVGYLILPPVTSAQITTKNKWSFKYGKVEIRAKLPRGDWIYPELYLNPQIEHYGHGYASGQIRVAFLPGNEDSLRTLHGGCILGKGKAARSYGIKVINKHQGYWCDDFHKFTLIWKPDQITVSVDDQVYGNIYAPERDFPSELGNIDRWRTGSKFAPFDQEMYLAIGVGVGGHNFEDRSDGSKPWVNKQAQSQKDFYRAQSRWRPTWSEASALKVDYIKVWAL